MENVIVQVTKESALPEVSQKDLPRRLERIAPIAYLIAAIFLYWMMFGPRAPVGETAQLAGQHPVVVVK